MRVIHVAPTQFGPDGLLGGGERYPLELARAQASQVDCELISFGPRPGLLRDPSGLRVRVLPTLGHIGGHPAHPLAPGLVHALAGADIVHTHHMRSAPSRLAALRARATGQRVVVTDHGLAGGDWAGLLPRLFDRFLAVSAFSARQLGLPPSRTSIIYGGADTHRLRPDPTLARCGVLFVGRITPHKGIDRLIAALPARAQLRIAGSSGHDRRQPERDYPALLRQLAAGREVDFVGPANETVLSRLYQQAAVLALPSVSRTCYGQAVPVSELLGLVVLEAMASGTPVICSRIGGLVEVVEHGVNGFLVEPGDVVELRERLCELLDQPLLAARLGRNARQAVQERFTWEACAERALEAYREVMRTGPAQRPSRARAELQSEPERARQV